MAAVAEAEASRSGGGAGSVDSYIGSLISLTSKSEIRYEGVLFNINTKESSIGLKNVRSFGTEGRKKDGPQIPPSDKVYEYILFRGSDIKDLQVKSSPPVQPTQPIHDDPAIIQSHYSRPASLSTSMPSMGSGTVAEQSSHTEQPGIPRSTLQGGLPLYQPGGSVGSWGSSPAHPSANGSGIPLPMYWQGFYGPPSGGFPHVQQQPLFRPPPGLPIPHSMQQLMQYPGMNASPPTGSPNLPEVSSPLLPPVGSGTSSSQSLALTTSPPTLSPIQAVPLPSEMSSIRMPNKAPISSLPMTTPSSNLPLASSCLDTSVNLPPVSSKPSAVPDLTSPFQPVLQSVSVIGRSSTLSQAETSVPSSVTLQQLRQPGPITVSSVQPIQTGKEVAAVQLPLRVPSSSPAAPEARAPLLPLPTLSDQMLNGTGLQTHHSNRVPEKGRGHESSHPTTNFTEEFDFIAMNEKFKKAEVWGHLGRSKTQSRANEETANDRDADEYLEEGDVESSKFNPVYVKDDFFDTLSCNAFDRGSRNGRTKFSEQMKIDTETFGDFPRYRGRGGRGPGRGGRSRGAYYGRGYWYSGRGRG